MTEKIDQDFLSSIEFVCLDQSEAFIYQNVEHLEEVLKALNQRPKKLTQLNDISRLQEIYTEKPQSGPFSMYTPYYRQLISVHKFLSLELQCILNANQFTRKARIEIESLEPNRAKRLARALKLQLTLRRLPPV
jgi:hypothetical protein